MAQTRDWKGMKEMSVRLLHERTGQDLDTWKERITSEGFTDEQTLDLIGNKRVGRAFPVFVLS
jgi:hypothetical protein